MTSQTIRAATMARELEAERDFWKARALQLSEAVTELSERVAALEPPPPADVPVGEVMQ